MGLCVWQEYSGIFRSILHLGGMKHTGNQKVVTALLSESLYKGSYLPHTGLVLAYLILKPSTPLQSKIGACGVSLSGLPISNREIAAGGYPVISGWGLIRSPFAPPKRGKPHIFLQKIGVMSVRVQICSRKIPGTVRVCFHWWLCSARLHFKSNL